MATDPPDYYLDVDGPEEDESKQSVQQRPWVGVRFDCCGVYVRLYRSAEGTIYRGRCPQCLRSVRLRVGPDGTSARFFRAE